MDKVYFISKAQLKPANKQYSNLPNDYEMTLNSDSVIQECVDAADDIPAVQYDFVPISQLAEMENNRIVGKNSPSGNLNDQIMMSCLISKQM